MILLTANDRTHEQKTTSQTSDGADNEMITSENFDDLLGHIIWPLTLVLILLIFKRNLSHVFKRMGSFSASATGVSMTFDAQIEAAEAEVLKKREIKTKSGVRLKSSGSKAKTKSPHYQLMTIRADLRDLIVKKAEEFNIETDHKSSLELRDELMDIDKLSPAKAHSFSLLINLTSSAGPEITKAQVKKIKNMYDHFSL